jgi:hypothetical protein
MKEKQKKIFSPDSKERIMIFPVLNSKFKEIYRLISSDIKRGSKLKKRKI